MRTSCNSGRLVGNRHSTSRSNLAAGYRATRRKEEALRLDEETLSTRERVLGPEHPDTANTRRNLARAYRAAGRDEDADRLEGKAVKGKPKRKRRRKEPRQPG